MVVNRQTPQSITSPSIRLRNHNIMFKRKLGEEDNLSQHKTNDPSPVSCVYCSEILLYKEIFCKSESPLCMYFVISFITIQLPFSEIFDGEVLVPVKGAEAVEFLSRKVSYYNHSGIVLPLLQTS